jgi:N-dimethylarginine dimethylaminohydrolase
MSMREADSTRDLSVRSDQGCADCQVFFGSIVPNPFESPIVVVSALECQPRAGSCIDESGCRYQVSWSINPHMQVGAVDFSRARQQHETFKRALASAGATVLELPFVHGAFDSVFAKDPALLFEDEGGLRALLASHRFSERRAEQAARARHFESLGCEVVGPPPFHWEGGDVVVVPPGDSILFGYGPRSDRRAASWLERQTQASVLPLELRDPYFFHLDTALGVLPDATALVYEEAFTSEALRALRAWRGVGEILSVGREDALRFALNLVVVGDVLVCGTEAAAVRRIVHERGFGSIAVELDEFHLSGGSAACLATRVHRDPRALRGAEAETRSGDSYLPRLPA